MRMLSFSILFALGAFPVFGQSVFIPENGPYVYDLNGITLLFQQQEMDYVSFKGVASTDKYKLNSKRNEFQIKDWYLRDWFKMQAMFSFDPLSFMRSRGGSTFNEAKRKQYAGFSLDRKKFFHYKTTPAMKEWGGLTHPPLKRLTLPLEKYHNGFKPIDYSKVSSPYFNPALQVQIDDVSRSELSFGNSLKALADRDAYIEKLRIIKRAKKHILMSSLVFVCDASTRLLVEELIQKYREGVDVKIMVDGTIGKVLRYRECLHVMRRAGIEVVETKDFFKHKMKAIYHTKTLVTDFSEAVAGGHNMIDADNLSRGIDFTNRDVDLYVKGPMVSDIAKQFIENWHYQKKLNPNISSLAPYEDEITSKIKQERAHGLRGKNFYSKVLGSQNQRMQGVCRFIKQAPYEDRHTIGKAYLKLLDEVRQHLVITDPVKSDTYTPRKINAPAIDKFDSFEMYNQLHLKVQGLAKSGTKIDYITTNITMAGNENVAILNEKIKEQLEDGEKLRANWSLFKLEASNSFYGKPHYKNLLKDWVPLQSVQVWTHISFLHSKIFYFDRIVSSVGSYNFQHNATDHAYESTAICMDEKLNRELDQILVHDMVNSIPLIFSKLR